MTQRRPSPFATEATAPTMGLIRLAFLMWRLQGRRVMRLTTPTN